MVEIVIIVIIIIHTILLIKIILNYFISLFAFILDVCESAVTVAIVFGQIN